MGKRKYKRLHYEDRQTIEAMSKQGSSVSDIAEAQQNCRGIRADKPSKGHFGRGKRRRAGKLRKSAGEFAIWRTWRADAGKRR